MKMPKRINRGGVQWVMPLEEFWSVGLSAQKDWVVTAYVHGSDAVSLYLILQSLPLLNFQGGRVGA